MPSNRASRHFRLTTLGRGIYAAIATATGFGMCNAGIVDLGDRTVVFDSMLTPMAGADLARAAERCTGRKPDWIVNSHWHGDHIWGNSAFVGAHVVSSRKVREVVLRQSREQFDRQCREFPRELESIAGPGSSVAPADRPRVRAWFRGVIESPRRMRIVPPEITFDDALVLEGSRRSIHLITYGGGHSPSDVFAYLPDEHILFAGDLTLVDFHASVGDGRPRTWIRILRRMQRLGAERIVPGHGPLADAAALGHQAQYLGDLDRMAVSAVRRGISLEEARKIPAPARYRNMRFSFMFPDNMGRAYELASRAARSGPSV